MNQCSSKPNPDIANLCEYAFRRCLESNTNILILGTVGQTYESAKVQVAQIIKEDTQYRKIMGEVFYDTNKKK